MNHEKKYSKNLFLILTLLLCTIQAIENVAAEKYWYYQETANETNYSASWTNPTNAYDDDWTTYGEGDATQPDRMTINYTYPSLATGIAKINYSIGSQGSLITDVPTSCSINQKISLYFTSYAVSKNITMYCVDSTGNLYIDSDSGGTTVYARLYETGINWSISTNNIDIYANLSNGSFLSTFQGYAYNGTDYITFNTTTGMVELNLSTGSWNITLNITGYADTSNNINITANTYYNTTLQALTVNVLIINTLNENTGIIITDPFTIILTSLTYQYNYTTNSGSKTIESLPADTYIIRLENTNYSTREYSTSLLTTSLQTLNAYFLPINDTSSIGAYVKTTIDDPISSASITIYQYVNGSYVTISQETTDGLGYAVMQLQEGITYKWIITANTYTPKEFLLEPYNANTPYTFKLSKNTTSAYIPGISQVSYAINPTNTTLGLHNQTFSLTTNSPNGKILWTATTCNSTTNNISGSPNGATSSVTLNLTLFNGETITCNYQYNIDGYGTVTHTWHYNIGNYTYYQTTLIDAMEELKNEANTGKEAGWLIVIALFIILAACITMYQLSRNSTISIVTAISGLIFFAIIGWIAWPITIIITVIGGLTFFWQGTSGGTE